MRRLSRPGIFIGFRSSIGHRAVLESELGGAGKAVAGFVSAALTIAREQSAFTLLLRAYSAAFALGISDVLDPGFREAIGPAMAKVEQDGELAELLATVARMSGSGSAGPT